MKLLFRLITLMLVYPCIASAVENPWDRPLPFKQGTIHYSVSGSSQGTKILYVKNYGRTGASYTNTSMTTFGMTQKQHETTISTPEWIYTIDHTQNTGTKTANPMKFYIEEFNKLSSAQQKTVYDNAERMGLSMIAGMEGQVQKNAERILGYNCDMTSMAGVSIYTISGTGLPLKIETNIMGMHSLEVADSIDKSAPPSSKFSIPHNIQFESMPGEDRMLQSKARSDIQALLRGQRPALAPMDEDKDINQLSPEDQQILQQMMQMMSNRNQ